MSKYCKKIYVIQECSTIFPGYLSGIYPKGTNMQKYFKRVHNAERKFFNKIISVKILVYSPNSIKRFELIKIK